ncbi:MAG: hypothetical protein JSW54_03630, partial [Fidelibacterota bacterium]
MQFSYFCNSRFTLAFVFGAILCTFTTIPAQPTESVAILELEGRGISSTEAASLTDRLRSELVRIGTIRVVERGRMEQILTEQDFQLAGCTSDECAVEVGQLLGVTTMVAGSIGKVGSTYSIDLRTINVETAEITGSIISDYRGEIDGLLAEMRQIAGDLVQTLVAETVPTKPAESEQTAPIQPIVREQPPPPTSVSEPDEPDDRPEKAPADPVAERVTFYIATSYSRSFPEGTWDLQNLPITIGYYPRGFHPDYPIGILPFDDKGTYITINSNINKDGDVGHLSLSFRRVFTSVWDLSGGYTAGGLDSEHRSNYYAVGIGRYFNRFYIKYYYNKQDVPSLRRHGYHSLTFRFYPHRYRIISFTASRNHSQYGWNEILGESFEPETITWSLCFNTGHFLSHKLNYSFLAYWTRKE